MIYDSQPALVCCLLESVVPARYREAMLGDLIEEYNLRVESASPLTASRWVWSQAFRSVTSIAWSWLRGGKLARQYEHRYGRLPRHGDAEACSGLIDLEVGCPTASDAGRPCAGCVFLGSRNRWLRGCARWPWRNDLPRIDGNDYSCRLDRTKGLHDTSPVVV